MSSKDTEHIEKYFSICEDCAVKELGSETEIVRAILGAYLLLPLYPESIPLDISPEAVRQESELTDFSDDEITTAIKCANSRMQNCTGSLEIWKSKLGPL